MPTKQMTISPRFFKAEKDNYGEWAFAFWRELHQNSLDAGGRNLKIAIDQTTGSDELGAKAWIEFKDDGHGMTSEVRDDVYFRLGETTKDGQDSMGGFGKARLLTCFAHHQYELWSHNWYVIGQGSGYTVSENPDRVNGVNVRVLVDATDRWGQTVDMGKALRMYLAMSQLDCDVDISYGGGEYTPWKTWCYKRRLAKSLSFGNVYVNKSGNYKGYLLVRLRGAPMFYRSIAADAQVVIEIDPKAWRKILVSNRDDLLSGPNDELSRFIQAIAVDKVSALRASRKRKSVLYGDTPRLTCRVRKAPASQRNQDVSSMGQSGSSEDARPVDFESLPHLGLERGKDLSVTETNHGDTIKDEILNAAMVLIETDNKAMLKVVNSYRPENWQLIEWDKRPGNPYMKGRIKRDLLRLWTIACDEVISCWLEMRDLEQLAWIPGFIFSDDCQAQCQRQDNGAYALLFVPVKEDGKMRLGIRKPFDWCQLIADACHEVVHTSFSPHDECYANLLTDLLALAMNRKKAIFKRFREALKKA